MKMKRLTFIFEQPLDKVIFYQGYDCTQEEILYTDVNGVRLKIRKELNKVLRSINMVRVINPAMFDVLKYHVQNLEHKLEWMVEFRKVSPTRYEFIYPMDANAIFTIKDFASKLGPLKKFALGKMENEDLQLVKILREAELIKAFTDFSFKEMKLEPGTYEIAADEFESDPEEPKKEEATQPAIVTGHSAESPRFQSWDECV